MQRSKVWVWDVAMEMQVWVHWQVQCLLSVCALGVGGVGDGRPARPGVSGEAAQVSPLTPWPIGYFLLNLLIPSLIIPVSCS